MKQLLLVLFLLFLLPSCSTTSEKPKRSAIFIAGVGSNILGDYGECSSKEAIKEDILKAFVKDKSILGPVCINMLKTVLPKLVKDKVIPARWNCKATRIDISLNLLAEKVCSKL